MHVAYAEPKKKKPLNVVHLAFKRQGFVPGFASQGQLTSLRSCKVEYSAVLTGHAWPVTCSSDMH